MPRTITLDYTAAVQQSAGMGRYARDLTCALVELQSDVDWRLFVAGGRSATLNPSPGHATYRLSAFSERSHNRLWQRLRLPVPVELWSGSATIFHSLDTVLPPTLPGTKKLVTIHDLSFERYPGETMPGMLKYLKRAVPYAVKRADHVIVVSESTRRDLIELYGMPPQHVTAVLNGVDPRFAVDVEPDAISAVRHKYNLPAGPLVFTLGTLQPRKNHRRLVEAFARISTDAVLVIAGGYGWAYEGVYAAVKRLGLENRVIFIGYVDDADLPALYRAASVFAYPSLYEGFGLPALEAMACGIPVLASDASSLPEVVGSDGTAGLLVDALNVDAIAAGLKQLLTNSDLRIKLAQNGVERAKAFTWARAARETWALYQQVTNK